MKKGGLGKGIDAIFNENTTDNDKLITVKLTDVEPNRDQPRKSFDEAAINELADSIKEHGLLQPIIVKAQLGGTYRIIAGERRWRACRQAGLESVPVIVKEFSEQQVMEVALIENLQRQDLNAVEEALGYKTLMDTYGMTQEQVAGRVGKSRPAVANALRLLLLEKDQLDALKDGKITAGHARALLSAPDTQTKNEMFAAALGGASVRELEKMTKQKKSQTKAKKTDGKRSFYTEVEIALTEALHRKVKVSATGNDSGNISIEFYGDEELSDIAEKLGKQ